jgi:S-(hydroxymethyl)glutathione dehydrogenase/alcohol dehydrogenase
MNKSMRAAILVAQRQPLVIDDVELPDRLSYGQALVKVCYSGICGSQLGEIDGVKGEDPYLPHLLGHEGSGVVEAVGPGVKIVRPGDHVVMHWMKGDGIESETPVYRWRGERLNAGWVTTFNEYAIVSENRLTPIPDDFDMEIAPLLGCAITTGLGVVNNNARVKIGESVVVFGVGGVGLSVVQGAAMVSAHPIIAVDVHPDKLELSKKLGATHGLYGNTDDLKAAVRQIVGSKGADVVVDTTGAPPVIEMAYELTQPRGRTILVGVPKAKHNISIHSLPLHSGKTLAGSLGGESKPSEDIPRYIRLAQTGKLNLKALITDDCELSDINEMIGRMRRGRIAGRCIVRINKA